MLGTCALIICHLAGLVLLQSDFQSWDIIPTQVPKLLLLNFLVAELLKDSGIVPMSIQDDLPRQGLHDSFEAAAILAQALKEKQELTHG